MSAVGYVDIDESRSSDDQYRYWCPAHVPAPFRLPWREIDVEEAAEADALCAVCQLALVPAVSKEGGERDA